MARNPYYYEKDDTNNDNDKVKNSKFHTLFEEFKSEDKEEVVIDGQTLYKIKPSYTNYRMFIDSFAEEERGLHEIFNTLWNAGDRDRLELRINSWGGFVKEGQNFYNLIKNKFNGRTTTILDSAGYSMGAITFCLGDERIVMEQSDLMFHDYSGMSWGKGGEQEAQVTHTAKHLRKFFKSVIVDKGFLSQEEFDQMVMGKDFWMEVPEMCQRGIATHVLVNGEKVKAKKYLKEIKYGKKKNNKKSK